MFFVEIIAAQTAANMRHREAEFRAERNLLKTMSSKQRVEYRIKKEKEREIQEQRRHEIRLAEIKAEANKKDDGAFKFLFGFLFGQAL